MRLARKAVGLNQAELAERIERTSEAVSNIERAKSLPALDTLMAIAEALHVPLKDFFPDDGFPDNKSPNRVKLETEVMTILRGLPDDRVKIALAQLRALTDV